MRVRHTRNVAEGMNATEAHEKAAINRMTVANTVHPEGT